MKTEAKSHNVKKEGNQNCRQGDTDAPAGNLGEKGRLTIEPDSRLVEMEFYLEAEPCPVDSPRSSSSLRDDPTQIHLIYFPGFRGTINYAPIPGSCNARLAIRFNLAFLESVIGREEAQNLGMPDQEKRGDVAGCFPVGSHSITPQMRMCIHELIGCNEEGKIKRLYWLSKMLELLKLEIAGIEAAKKPPKSIKSYDIGKLEEAKSIVEHNLASPYSLKALAHKVGLNDFKLKKGFKELFGYTVFGYLHELRMLEARKLLVEGTASVSIVSDEVGYQHPHHFAAAFKKRFGILPGTLHK